MPARQSTSIANPSHFKPQAIDHKEVHPLGGILFLDAATGVIVDTDHKLLDLLGTTYTALVGKAIWDVPFFQGLSFDQEVVIGTDVMRPIRFEHLTLQSKDGKLIPVDLLAHMFRRTGSAVIILNFFDRTGRLE